MHLINKIYALGYMLHRYKDPSRPWGVFAMDNKISEEGESHGGTGKSIWASAPKFFMKYVDLNGRDRKLTDNPHIFEKVNIHIDYILVDDTDQYLNFGFFYKPITGDLEVNPKGIKQYSIPFEESPKFVFTSNFALRDNTPSAQRRVLYSVFSDYYHYNSSGEYRQHRSPEDDFGKGLFRDFTNDEWNVFINFMAQCVKFYLSHPVKVDPPMKNVELRNLKTQMTDAFLLWADVYFLEGDALGKLIEKEVVKNEAFEDYQKTTNSTKVASNTFTKRLKAWCKYQGFIYNPEDKCNAGNGLKKNRIIRSIDGKAIEYCYIGKPKDQEENKMEF